MATEVSTALWVDYALQYGGARRRAPGGGLLVRLARGVGKRRVGTAGLARTALGERGEVASLRRREVPLLSNSIYTR